MFETTFKNLDDTLRKDDGCSTEMDYIEQTSWVLFLKYLDDFEADREATAKLSGQLYKRILEDEYAWHVWAAPKRADGKLDYNSGLTGDDLKEFVDNKLFPYLRNFKVNAERADSIEYKIGEIFSELKNKLVSGYSLREVINKVDELRFRSNEEKHEMSSLYEDKIKSMGNAGRNGGEYYTPRPLINTIVKVVNPQIGNKVYDGAVGSAGFLCEAYDYMRNSKQLTATEYEQLQKKTFYGKEKKSLAYIIGVMNMILHGIEAPNIQHSNTLAENISDIQDKDRVDVILANPPFGSSTEHFEVQQNFPIKSGETAYMFLQHFIKMLKRGGRCGVVIKNTFLSNPDNASVALRKQLLEECEITAILDLPKGVFTGTGVSTVVLFFTKGKPTTKVWYYQLNLARNLGKTNSLNEQDLADFIRLSASQGVSDNSWFIDIKDIDKTTWDLTVTNPNHIDVTDVRTPELILEEIEQLDIESTTTNFEIKRLLNEFYERGSERWEVRTIEQMIEKTKNVSPDKNPETEFTYVDVSSISNTSFSIVSTQKLLGKDAPSRAKKNILKNDILYATVRPTLKRIAIVPEHLDNQVASTGYVVLRANKNNYFKFLFYFLFTNKFFRAMETLQRGASYPAVTDGDVKSQTLLAPKFEEQKLVSEKIEEIISNIDLKIDSELKKIDELKALKQSILQQAFSGELVKD